MGPFARKYGKCSGSEAWTFVFMSATSFGISAKIGPLRALPRTFHELQTAFEFSPDYS